MTALVTQSSTPRSARAQSASLQFFGAAEDRPTVSPWFHPEDLNAPDFDASAYVLELRQYAPLESLSEELQSYLATLKSKVSHSLARRIVDEVDELQWMCHTLTSEPLIKDQLYRDGLSCADSLVPAEQRFEEPACATQAVT